jgi:outer membrane immunogenic protein
MRRIQSAVLATVAVVGLASVAYADGSDKRAYRAPVAMPAYSWTGFYMGANVGGSWGTSAMNAAQAGDPVTGFGVVGCAPVGGLGGCSFSQNNNLNGLTGGLQLGYNYQTGVWVYGIEADIDWRSRQQGTTQTVFNGFGDNDSTENRLKWISTVRGRLGYAPADKWLAYVTAGVAFGSEQNRLTQTFCVVPTVCDANARTVSDSVTKTGWAAGAGVQYALSSNWSVGFEYLYINLGKDTLTGGTVIPGVAPLFINYPAFSATFQDTVQVARLRVDYKF